MGTEVDQEDIPDETAVGVSPGSGGAETEIVPQVERPETVTAWSEADDDALTQPWPAVWKRATLVASVGSSPPWRLASVAGWRSGRTMTLRRCPRLPVSRHFLPHRRLWTAPTGLRSTDLRLSF